MVNTRRTSQFCRELTDGTAANGLSIGEAFGERAALLLAMPLEGDDVTSGNTAVTTDTMGWDLSGIEELVQMGSAHPQALRDLGGRIADCHQGPASLPLGRGLVAVVTLG